MPLCDEPSRTADFLRSLEHWKAAAERLADADLVASPQAWRALEHYLGVSLRNAIATSVSRLKNAIARLELDLTRDSAGDVVEMQSRLVHVRQLYFRAETTVDFYSDCLASRTVPRLAAILRACDHIATRSMAESLAPMGREVPAALTYVDKGIGASVIRAGIRLWDGTVENPVSTIKVTRHNLIRPCAALHESGHQVAATLGWVPELAEALRTRIRDARTARVWSAWASEIAADAHAHVHLGFGAAAALHDVLDGADSSVFALIDGDPHPVSFARVLMALEMSRQSFGDGPWEPLRRAWMQKHPIDRCPADVRELMIESMRFMPAIVELVLFTPYRAFGNRPITQLIDPRRVSPAALEQLSREAGASAYASGYWTWNEAIRLLALTSYRAAQGGAQLREALEQQERWMMHLGGQRAAA